MPTEADGDIWKQREETVFQINDQFRRFWVRGDYNLGRKNGNGDEIAYFVPIMFDKANRTFNWVAAANPILEAATSGYENSSSTKYAQDALRTVLKSLWRGFFKSGDEKKRLQWHKFEDRYSDQPGAFKEYVEVIHETVAKYGGQSEGPNGSESSLSNENFERVWTAILMAYSCYSHPSDENFEGIFFRILEDVGHTRPQDIADAVFGVANGRVLDLTDWKNARGSSFPECPLQDGDGRRTMSKPDKGGLRYSDSRIEEAGVLQSAFLSPLLMDWDFGEGKTLKRISESHNFRLLVPIYDVWNGTQGWGGLKAVLVIFLEPPEVVFEDNADLGKEKIGNQAWQPNYEKMRERCGEFAQEIGQAATRRALSRPIMPLYDLVRQFLRILIEVQDWEEAVIFYDENPNYSFKRVPHDNIDKEYKGVRKGWKEEEWKEAGADQQFPGPCNELSEERNEFYMWWTSEKDKSCQDLWSQAVLPGLSDEERAEVGGISIRFKFPRACRIPPDLDTRKFLVEAYRRQQLDLMRGLIPKVRARRAALRNAVSAIMARNMSHNIGSHVLARYASTISKDGPRTLEGQQAPPPNVQPIDPRTDFLIYLEKRMDFLAEIGTSDKAFWTQPLVLKTQLDQLSLDVQIGRLAIQRGARRLAAMSPMLAYISGKDGMRANVTFVGNEKLLFSCPGGEVGVHALYVVLENIIRNSARHNMGRAKTGQVEIHVHARIGSDAPDSQGALFPPANWPGLVEFRILDVRSELGPDGRRQSEPGEKKWDYKNGERLRQMFDDWRISEGNDDEKTPDKFLESLSIPDRLNWIIQNERIINDDGRPSPKFLGIREIQICAQYLRQFFLSDLEDVPYSERDNAANQVPLIRAECFDRGNGKYCLSYVLYLQEVKLLEILHAEPEESKIAETLADLRNHVFVAYDGSEAAIINWVEKFKRDLPVRRLRTIPQGLDRLEPQKQIETLYQIYAQQIQGGGAVLAGLALMANGEAGVASARPVCLAPAEQEAWQDWLSTQACGGQQLDACVWVDHPTETKLNQLEHWATEAEEAGNSPVRSISVELIYSDSPATPIIRSLQSGEGWELIAAALPRVVVLDERVQTEAKKDIRDLKAERYWQLMHVHVPDRETEADLDYPKFDQCRKYLKASNSKIDYLVLHLSILESLAQQQKGSGGGESIFSTIDALTFGTPSQTAQVVIVTGRGVQTFDRSLGRAQREVRYLPVSALLEYLVHRPSKLGLMRVIWSALPLIVRETDA